MAEVDPGALALEFLGHRMSAPEDHESFMYVLEHTAGLSRADMSGVIAVLAQIGVGVMQAYAEDTGRDERELLQAVALAYADPDA